MFFFLFFFLSEIRQTETARNGGAFRHFVPRAYMTEGKRSYLVKTELTESATIELRVRDGRVPGPRREHLAELLVGSHVASLAVAHSTSRRKIPRGTSSPSRRSRPRLPRCTTTMIRVAFFFFFFFFMALPDNGVVVPLSYAKPRLVTRRAAFLSPGESSSARNYRIPAAASARGPVSVRVPASLRRIV